ncbi:MAG TPA: ABC transporter permease [Candidatus Omnitrophota bacterium]|nr:ABC transporter permease [Candidatus Omnitrophota bacterium]HPS37072.1 ABC transporter permease [Candidatus Omnitrophota bacterium]
MSRWGDLKKAVSVRSWLEEFGRLCLDIFKGAGGIAILFVDTCSLMVSRRIRWKATLDQMNKIGVTSLPLVFLTSLFTGMVLALQSTYQLRLFSAEQFTSDLISVSLCRELGPVLTAMVVAGRVGASIAAELGTMKVTEQIDALKALATNPIQYLVIPRFIAGFSMLFILTIYADIIGMFGGYLISVFKLGMSSPVYIKRGFDALVVKDVVTGLIKAFVFGGIISVVGCYFGFHARGGAEGVGRATTLAVVVSLIMVIASDALFTAIFYFI